MGKARHARPRSNHALFGSALIVAAVVRLLVVFGYPPALWFSDSLPYLKAVSPLSPSRVRPAGYPFFLALLAPFHSVWLVTVVQAVMGLVTATAVYAVLRRYKLPGWAATLAAAPVLFSVYELQLEHFVLSDTFFGLLVTVAVVGIGLGTGFARASNGWYLLTPPTFRRDNGDFGIGLGYPLNKWTVQSTYDSAGECQQHADALSAGQEKFKLPLVPDELRVDLPAIGDILRHHVQCVPSDDPRLTDGR